MRLLAISDLHLSYEVNRTALAALRPHPEDWLIVAGDLAESLALVETGLRALVARFARVLWTPGNHELWGVEPGGPRGVARYEALVALCRRLGVVTPEDDHPRWEGPGGPHRLAPLFVLYDYSFRPSFVRHDDAVAWAGRAGVMCADEHALSPAPFPSRPAWCEDRVRRTEARLDELVRQSADPLVLINHFPLKEELVFLPFIPTFSIWCGTRRTEDWHRRYRASVVVTGHLHIRRTDVIDGVRFEEVSLGYPRQWRRERGIEGYLRQILPAP